MFPSHDQIRSDYLAFQAMTEELLSHIKDGGAEPVIEQLRRERDTEERAELKQEVGQWFADYLDDNGYAIQISPPLIKYMIRTAFPPIAKRGIESATPENLEKMVLRYIRVVSNFHESAGLGEESDDTPSFAHFFSQPQSRA